MRIKDINFKNAEWTHDCNGKQDFDFNVLSVDVRYWNDFSAKPHIRFGDKVLFELPIEEYITGLSELECKEKVEKWIYEKIDILITKLEI